MSGYVERIADLTQDGRGIPVGIIQPGQVLPIWHTKALHDTEPKPAALNVVGEEDGYSVVFANYTGTMSSLEKYPIEGEYAVTGYHPQFGNVRIFPTPQSAESRYPKLDMLNTSNQTIIADNSGLN